jgi:hypothetical protein
MDEPPIDMAIPSYLVSRAARESMRVMLSGYGWRRSLCRLSAADGDEAGRRIRSGAATSATAIDEDGCSGFAGGMPGKLTAPLRNAKKVARSAGARLSGPLTSDLKRTSLTK